MPPSQSQRALALLACVAGPGFAAAEAPKPNILFMFADDLGYNNVGFRNPELKTPGMDELAKTGVILDRHYTFKYCSPTRSSFMSGRLPIHVTQNNKNNDVENPGGADLRMTLLPKKLKAAGYRTSMFGKWHVGARSTMNLPINRGFDRHMGFLKGGEDHINQHSPDGGKTFVDLWKDNEPAHGLNGTFSTYLYCRAAVAEIKSVAASAENNPFFMYLPWHATHTPLESPAGYVRPAPNDDAANTRAKMRGLIEILDEGIRNVTQVLKETGLWNNTLVVFSADNGGWVKPAKLGGNNYPLRGGKVSSFEGGTRVNAFVNGGFLPDELRGTTNTGLMHVCDWYSTFCALAGVDPTDSGEGIPPIDSVNLWPSISQPSSNETARSEIPLAICLEESHCDESGPPGDSALIRGKYKFINGTQGNIGFYQGPLYPNSTSGNPSDPGCPEGCLFDIFADPEERNNLKDTLPEVYQGMLQRLAELTKTVFQTDYSGGADTCISTEEAYERDHGFLAPRCSKN